MKKFKQRLCGVLAAFVLAGSLFTPLGGMNPSVVQAAENVNVSSNLPTGDLKDERVYHLSNTFKSKELKSQARNYRPRKYYSSQYTYKWQNYGSDYFYKKMSRKEQKFYDLLQATSMEFLNNKKNMNKDYSVAYECDFYFTSPVEYNISEKSAVRVMQVFTWSNPQYYFYDHGYVSEYIHGRQYYALTVYPKFNKGSSRLNATKQYNKQLTKWLKEIKKEKGDYNKILKIQQFICTKVTYHENRYDQNSYSVFCGNQTVCAGYATAFTVLCGASGIKALTLTSCIPEYAHAWNMVMIHGNWYNIDATWADQYDADWDGDGEEDLDYTYTLRSDKEFLNDIYSKKSHTPEPIWKKYKVPKANLDSEPGFSTVGKVKTLEKPTGLKLERNSKGVKLSWNKVSGAKYYIIQRKTADGSWKVVAKKCTKLSYTDKTVKKNKTYYYRVSGMKSDKTVENYCGSKKIKVS